MMLRKSPYLCLAFLLSGLPCALIAAERYDFELVPKTSELGSSLRFYADSFADRRKDPDANAFYQQIEASFERISKRYTEQYDYSFSNSILPRVGREDGTQFFPVLTIDRFDPLRVPPTMASIQGPHLSDGGQGRGYANAYVLNGEFFGPVLRSVERTKQAKDHLFRRYSDLAVANAVAHTAAVSQCSQDLWPQKRSATMPTTGFPTVKYTFLNTIARAQAIDLWNGPEGFFDKSSYARVSAIADTIARMEFDPYVSDEVEELAKTWLGAYSLESGFVDGTNFVDGSMEIAKAPLSPIEMLMVARDVPTEYYRIGRPVNMLAAFDLAETCRLAPRSASDVVDNLALAFTSFEDRFGGFKEYISFRHRDLAVVAQQIRITLPFMAAQFQGKPSSIYGGTFLDAANWEKTLFPEGGGCKVIDLSATENGYEWTETLHPFGVRCYRVSWSHDEVRPINISVNVLNAKGEELEALESIVLYQDFQRRDGALTREYKERASGPSTAATLSYYITTESKYPKDWERNQKETYIYFHNIAKNFVDSRELIAEFSVVSPNTRTKIDAVDIVKGKSRKDPPKEVRAPSLPNPLYTPASFDLETLEDDRDPKLTITFTHTKGMEALYEEYAKVTSDTMNTVESNGMLASRFAEEYLDNRVGNLSNLAAEMRKITENALNNSFNETINVIIEAPAPAFGYTGALNDVLISVNWSDKEGKPYDAESIGPEDLSPSEHATKYLNNGTLNILEFSPQIFVAEFSGRLTDEPILPPMGPPIKHLDRVVTGSASGTIVISNLSLQTAGDRELDQEYFFNRQQAGLDLIERVSKSPSKNPNEDNDSDEFEDSSGGSRSGNSGSGSLGIANRFAASAPACDCSCDAYWSSKNRGDSCLRSCQEDFKICRTEQPSANASRIEANREAIDYYWKYMGVSTEEAQQVSMDKIKNMLPSELETLLDTIEMIGGPKKQ